MKKWESALIRPDSSLREAMLAIESLGAQLAIVVDSRRHLLGTVSDGDVRRALLNGFDIDNSVDKIMHIGATVVNESISPNEIIAKMRHSGRYQLPIVNEQYVVTGLALINDYISAKRRQNWVVIMAGGLGKRLKHLTLDTPKPMLKVGSNPLLETIIRGYADQGFNNFYLAVNYKADQIEEYFGNGVSFGVNIRYIRENKRMGTAGALSLLHERPNIPFLVGNADLLTNTDFTKILDEHYATKAQATMAVWQHKMQVPFGVVEAPSGNIKLISEKPVYKFMVSGGINVFSPTVLDLIPKNSFLDMPSLFEIVIRNGMKARTFEIDGYWRDVGQISDFELANKEFAENFHD